jgi:hypothetical protein
MQLDHRRSPFSQVILGFNFGVSVTATIYSTPVSAADGGEAHTARKDKPANLECVT